MFFFILLREFDQAGPNLFWFDNCVKVGTWGKMEIKEKWRGAGSIEKGKPRDL